MNPLDKLQQKISTVVRDSLIASGHKVRDYCMPLNFDLEVGNVANPGHLVVEISVNGGVPSDVGEYNSKTEIMTAIIAASLTPRSSVDVLLFADEEVCRPTYFELWRGDELLRAGKWRSEDFWDTCLPFRQFDDQMKIVIL